LQVTFSAKLQPAEKVTFKLRYEELLQRSEQGKYSYVVNIQPQTKKIQDFKLRVNINETLPIEAISILRAKDKDAAKFQAEDITKSSLISSNNSTQAIIETSAQNNDQDWKFFINYDVKRPTNGNDIQIGAGRFVHYFAPDNIPTMAKHIIFVIDISGSMSGRKLEQTKDAMTAMLSRMSEANLDNFNIILFHSNVTIWKPLSDSQLSYSILKKNGDVSEAYDFTLKLKAGALTNINEALIRAINLANDVKRNEEIGRETQQMIVFLTDGEPTEGETSGTRIKENVNQYNSASKIPIYGLAFGDGADFNLLKDISTESRGFAQKIYESGNSFEQLEDFYNKISGKFSKG
jgi:uncharacterized protein YegL